MAESNRLGQRASGQTVQAIAATLPLDTASPNGLACALRFCVWDCLQESLDLVSRNGESFSCGDRGAVNPTGGSTRLSVARGDRKRFTDS